jgi:nucleoside-diphosphate-sugar epimerase
MKVLVTGGNGFIGRHVVAKARERGHGVRVLVRPCAEAAPSSAPRDDVEFVQRDLRQPGGLVAAVEGVDAVVHCAAAMGGDLATQLAVTVEGTRNLLAAMKQAGVRHIAGLSSFAVYDYLQLPDGALLDEDSPLDEHFDARAPYIQAKRIQEDLIREQAGASGWRWTILRPGIVYGKGRTWFHHLGMQLSPGRWVCLAGDSLLPLTHVESCAGAVLDALANEAANGATLNIVDDDLPGRRRYMDALAQRTSPRPSITGVPWALLDRAARAASWTNRTLLLGKAPLPDLLLPASLHARCKPLRYSNQRAKQVLGWKPRWNLEEGLDRSFAKSGGE